MGTPDQTLINEFAANTAEEVVCTLIGVGTLVGGLLAGRKAKVDALQNGLAVGLITALIGLVFSFLSSLNLWTVVSFALSVAGGWVGGQLASKRA
jgi:putative membrane protein (TIGR04086 family)